METEEASMQFPISYFASSEPLGYLSGRSDVYGREQEEACQNRCIHLD